jgi:hypothetical protein
VPGVICDLRSRIKRFAMKNAALVVIMVAIAAGSGFHRPASAQSAIGGVKKQTALGGPVKQTSPVVPVNRAAVVTINKPAPVVALNRPAPVAPVNKPAPAVVAASASAHVKCAGSCAARGPR